MEDRAEANPPRWTLPASEVTDSVGGTHQLHRFVGRWSGGEPGQWAVLTDKASGAAVLDMAGVKTATVCWRADGALLVRIGGRGSARLFVVAADMRSFRDIGIDPADQPLSALQAAVGDAVRDVGADDGPRQPRDLYLDRDFSPDGDLIIEYAVHTQRMSHETRVPRLILAATGETLLTMPDSQYDGEVHWGEGTTLSLHIRRYDDGSRGLFAEVDWGQRTITIGPEIHPLKDSAREIVGAFKRMRSPASTGPSAAAAQPGRYRAAFAVIALMILVMGGIALGAWWSTETPKQILTPIPAMPKR